jgi:hypothetical protein
MANDPSRFPVARMRIVSEFGKPGLRFGLEAVDVRAETH